MNIYGTEFTDKKNFISFYFFPVYSVNKKKHPKSYSQQVQIKKLKTLKDYLTSSPTLRKEIPDFSPGETRSPILTGSCFTDSPTRISTGLKSRMPCGYRK